MDNKDIPQGLTPGTLLRDKTYRIEKILGQGGFGITYLATDLNLDLKVAIKEFFPKDYCDREGSTSHVTLGTSSTGEFVERLKVKFLKEARNIAKFKNSSIIRILAAFEENNTAYYVMEYIEGSTLSEIVKRSGPIAPAQAMEYIEKVGEALEYIHAKKINHLDVKPANIMVRVSDNEPILIDFGLSKQYDREGHQTSTTPTGISHGYAPMEQYKAGGVKEFSPQTDLYSLAATLYYILTGVVPPQAPELLEESLTFPETIPASMINTISKAMSSGRKQRHESVKAFIQDLKKVKEDPTETFLPVEDKKGDTVPVVKVDMSKSPKPAPKPMQKDEKKVAEAEKPVEVVSVDKLNKVSKPTPQVKTELPPVDKVPVKNEDNKPAPPAKTNDVRKPEVKPEEKSQKKVENKPEEKQIEVKKQESEKPKPVKVPDLTPPPVTPVSKEEKKGWKAWYTYGIAAGCVVAAALLIVFFVLPSKKSVSKTDDSVSSVAKTEVSTGESEDARLSVSNVYWDSPLGPASYTGTVANATLNDGEPIIPDGQGELKIVAGKYEGNVYIGGFVNGVMEGESTYTLKNGDVFKGTFHNNKYEKGRYTWKEDGGSFEGSFKEGIPDQGDWFDKQGNKIQ